MSGDDKNSKNPAGERPRDDSSGKPQQRDLPERDPHKYRKSEDDLERLRKQSEQE